MKYWPGFILLLIAFSSCTKEIQLKDLPQPTTQLVVEGHIENGTPPIILLTRNSPYFGGINLNDLSAYFVHNANVSIYSDGDTIDLVEYCVDDFPEEVQRQVAGFFGYEVDDSTEIPNICIYSIGDLINYYLNGDTTVFLGRVGGHYGLKIVSGTDVVTSSTTIPGLLPFTLSYRAHDDPTKDSLVSVLVTYDDPDTTGNFLRYFTKRNSEPFYAPLSSSVYDDNVIAGSVLTLPLERGQAANSDIDFDTYGYFWRGDTVTVKFSSIDKAHYDFWQTVENDGGDSPFSSPVRIKGNIQGGLGIWGGYGSFYATIIIPE